MDELGKLAAALRNLGEAFEKALPEGRLDQSVGWDQPPLYASDLTSHAKTIADQIDGIVRSEIRDDYTTGSFITRIDALKDAFLPSASGNNDLIIRTFFQFTDWLRTDFEPFFSRRVDWESIAEADKLPRQFARRLRTIQKMLDSAHSRAENLDAQISTIASAYETAMNLPTDADEMRETKSEIESLRREAESDRARIALTSEKVSEILEAINASRDEAEKAVESTHDAYRAATTRGLGEAFQTRADDLAKTTNLWVAGLVSALIVGAGIGYFRVSALQSLLEAEASPRLIWLNLTLSVLSLAAPIWFAWIATKQIGHRFRLAEDYAFKASVAKAYEGYRREAARLDDAFVKRLFASILDRLEEAPIRFVENETPGSPWQEMFGRSRAKAPEVEPKQAPQTARRRKARTEEVEPSDDISEEVDQAADADVQK